MKALHLKLPDFALMPDDEVEQHVLTRTKDGRWSAQTRSLLKKFQTEQLTLNTAWAQTPVNWRCPCCQRDKTEIARLTDNGVLLCQLDWHHDHLSDAAGEIMRNLALRGSDPEIKHVRKRACAIALHLIERFAPTLLCNDCNAADTAMKALLKPAAPHSFSFTPDEIARFIKPASGKSHSLGELAGQALWPDALAQYEERMAFASSMGERIGAGLHDRAVSSYLDHSHDYEDPQLIYRLAWEAGDTRNRPNGLGEALLARSTSAAGRSATGRKQTAKNIRKPTIQEFRVLDAANTQSSPPWHKAGSDWQCPCCGRSKFEITRLSNKGKWRAAIMLLNDYSLEADSETIRRRGGGAGPAFLISQYQRVGVCHDCRQIVTDAVSVKPGIDQDSLRLVDLQKLAAEARPHQSHGVAKENILAVIEANADWIDAVKDFWVHHDTVKAIMFELQKLRHNKQISEASARSLLIPQLVGEGKLPTENSEGWFDWMIAEAARLSSSDWD